MAAPAPAPSSFLKDPSPRLASWLAPNLVADILKALRFIASIFKTLNVVAGTFKALEFVTGILKAQPPRLQHLPAKAPFGERLLKKWHKVLFLSEAMDVHAIPNLPEFECRKLQNVAKEAFSCLPPGRTSTGNHLHSNGPRSSLRKPGCSPPRPLRAWPPPTPSRTLRTWLWSAEPGSCRSSPPR